MAQPFATGDMIVVQPVIGYICVDNRHDVEDWLCRLFNLTDTYKNWDTEIETEV